MASSALSTLAALHKHQELVKIDLNSLQLQHMAPNTQWGLNAAHSGEAGPGPQPGRELQGIITEPVLGLQCPPASLSKDFTASVVTS